MQSHDHMRQDELETAAPKTPTPVQGERNPLELAGQIGNSNMQRVAGSPALQRSPAAAGLIQRSPLARQEEDEKGEGETTPEGGAEKEAGGEEKAPEATPEGGAEGGGEEQAPEATPEGGAEKEAGGEEKEEEAA